MLVRVVKAGMPHKSNCERLEDMVPSKKIFRERLGDMLELVYLFGLRMLKKRKER